MLYKYFKVNDNSISNLSRNELYCQHYKAFNDPFECWFILKEGIPHPEREPEKFNEICKAWGYHPNANNGGLEIFDLYMDELESYQPDIQRYINDARISCFSKERDNLLMWAHYADGMRGYCLGFDEQTILSADAQINSSIIPVNYSEQPPIVDKMLYSLAKDQIWYHEMALEEEPNGVFVNDYNKGFRDAGNLLETLYAKTIATKPMQWFYEKEVRLIIYSDDNLNGVFFKYPADAIKEIILEKRWTPMQRKR